MPSFYRMTQNSEHRIQVAIDKIDLGRAGALEAFQAIQGSQSPEAYEKLAQDFPISFQKILPASNRRHARALLALNQSLGDKSSLVIKTGKDIGHSMRDRIPTGSLGLSYITSGGYPRGYIGQVKGGEGLGKTFAMLKAASEVLKRGGHVLWVALERFDKDWARSCGVPVHFSEEELADAEVVFGDGASEKMRAFNEQFPEGANFTLVYGRNGDEALQTIVNAVRLNAWDFIVLDSIAVVKNAEVLDKKDVGDETMGGEAKMINNFCARVEAEFNYVAAMEGRVLSEAHKCRSCGDIFTKKSDHKKCDGKKAEFDSEIERGDALRAAVLVINQIRDQGIGKLFAPPPDAGGGHGLRHAKGYDINFKPVENLQVAYGPMSVVYAKRVRVECTKSKIGPQSREAVLEIFVEDVPGVSVKGEFNPMMGIIGGAVGYEGKDKIPGLAVMAQVISYASPFYTIGDHKIKGEAAFTAFLMAPENKYLFNAVVAATLDWIREGCQR